MMKRVDYDKLEELLPLPFAADVAGDVNWWSVSVSGDDAADAALGETYARIAMEASREHGPALIAVMLTDMIRAGRFTAVEAGFVVAISSASRAGGMN